MPPSLTDWVADDHLVWTVLGAVEQMDLGRFYGVYRADGQGRAACDPAMMVALLLYSYSLGNRPSHGIERCCRVDVAYKVITALQVADHATIAEFRRRHETARVRCSSRCWGLCAEAGLVSVGVIAIDGTKIKASARVIRTGPMSRSWLRSLMRRSGPIVMRMSVMAAIVGMSCRSGFAGGRAVALAEAKQRLDEHRYCVPGAELPAVEIEIDEQRVVAEGHGRKGWLREGRRQLEQRREREQRPIPRSRSDRLDPAPAGGRLCAPSPRLLRQVRRRWAASP